MGGSSGRRLNLRNPAREIDLQRLQHALTESCALMMRINRKQSKVAALAALFRVDRGDETSALSSASRISPLRIIAVKRCLSVRAPSGKFQTRRRR